MSTITNSNPLLDEQVSFVQHALPGLGSGNYELTVSQTIKNSEGGTISDSSLTNTYHFAVTGDQFFLQNPGTIYSVFPPDNSSGEYSTVLPHVVLTKPTFPWTRYPTNTPPVTGLDPGQDSDVNVPTWLAILTFDEDDSAAFPALDLSLKNATIGDLYPPSLYPQSTLGSNYSYFYNASAINLQPGTSVTDTIQIIDIPLSLFWQVAPSLNDMYQTAHVRKVSLTDKATMPGISDVGEPVGSFSIVFGNRLAQQERRSTVFFVSLEMMQNFLPNEDGTMPGSSPTTDGTKMIRLAVLRSWSYFTVSGSPSDFTTQLLSLNGRDPESNTEAPITNLRIGYTGSNELVGNILSMGYTPLNHLLRTGEQTVSWYRGPLLPYNIPTVQLNFPIASPDQVTLFDPTTGMLDTSYATAWTIGRLTALQDKTFSTALYNWKRGLSQQVINAAEEELLHRTMGLPMQQIQAAALEEESDTPQPKARPGHALLHQTIELVSKMINR
ncbi:MAG: hypothetical protein IM638_10545 [Bacteroidetes bacterium]|nr:hypothetical protein [Bacteroidota bacterium]